MAIVTGTMQDFKLFSLFTEGGRIVFMPSEAAMREDGFLVTRPIIVYPDVYGNWSQNLAATTGLSPSTVHYKVRFEWLDPNAFGAGQGFVGVDYPDWELRVPPQGGTFADLVERPIGSGEVWIWTDDDTDPPRSKRGDFVYNPTTTALTQIA